MKTYNLKTDDGEIISKTNADDYNQAAEIFSIIKHLSIKSLLNIFKIEEAK